MYGSTNLSVGISLILRDQFSGRMANARRELDLTTAAGRRAERQSLESQRNMTAAGAIAGVTALATMREWVKVGAGFDKQMTYTYSIVDKTGKAGVETLDRLKGKAMEVGRDTMFSSTEVAGAMTTMAQAGQDYDQVLGNINSTAVLAAATMSGIEQSASAINDIMIGFDISSTEQNSMRVADIITRTINDSNIALDSYAETMKYVIPTARTLGVTLEEVSAITSVLGNAGLKGSMAGTGTENMIRLLAIAAGKEEGTKESKALAHIGLSPKDLTDAAGNLRPIQEILQLIGQGMMNLPNVERTKVITDLLNIRGGRPGQLLTFAEGLANFGKALDGINDSGGTAQKTANDVMGTLWGGMERLESTWETFKIAFTEAITPVLIPALQVITQILQAVVGFMSQPIGKWVVVMAAAFVTFKTGAMVYRTIVLSLQLLHSQLGIQLLRSSNQGVAGYNNLTAAATRYGAAAAAAGAAGMGAAGAGAAGAFMGTGPGGRQAMRKNSAGQWIWAQSGPGGKKGQFVSAAASKGYTGARVGSMLGKASPYAAIGGLALSYGAGMAEEGSGLQQGLELGGAALSGASMGAMLGSVVPGIGTAVGAVVGGVGGILWTLYDQTQAEKERLKAAEAEANNLAGSMTFEGRDWALQAKAVLEARSRAYAYMGNLPNNEYNVRAQQSEFGVTNQIGKPTQVNTQNRITVNIDGATAFNKRIDENNYTANVQFAF